MKLFQFGKKSDVSLPENPQKFFISNPTAKLNWFWNREKQIQKWVFRGLLIALAIWLTIALIYGLVKGFQWQNSYKADPTRLQFIPWNFILIGVVWALGCFLMTPLLKVLNTGHTIMLNFGGQGMMYTILKDDQIGKIVGIFAGIGALMFVLALAVRGIKISAARNAEMQEAYRQSTGLSIFGAVLGLFLITFFFFFVTGIVCVLGQWIITVVCGSNSMQIGTLVYNYGWLEGIKHYSEIPTYTPVAPLSFFLMLALAISATIFLAKFLIAIFGSIMKIGILFVSSFVSLGKWPQDEGAAFQGHKDDMISLFLNYLIAYFVFQFFMIMIGIIAPIAEQMNQSIQVSNDGTTSPTFAAHIIVSIIMFAAGAVSLTELQKRLPEIYMMNRNPSPNGKGNEVSSFAQNATRDAENAGRAGARDMNKAGKNSSSAKDKFMENAKSKGLSKKDAKQNWKFQKALNKQRNKSVTRTWRGKGPKK